LRSAKVYRIKSERDTDFSDIEANLRGFLRPVEPRPTFVNESRIRLVKASLRKRSQLMIIQLVILAIAGLTSSILILVVSMRAVITLLGMLGMLHLFREQGRQKRAISVRSL
jgi:hypothetical protein